MANDEKPNNMKTVQQIINEQGLFAILGGQVQGAYILGGEPMPGAALTDLNNGTLFGVGIMTYSESGKPTGYVFMPATVAGNDGAIVAGKYHQGKKGVEVAHDAMQQTLW